LCGGGQQLVAAQAGFLFDQRVQQQIHELAPSGGSIIVKRQPCRTVPRHELHFPEAIISRNSRKSIANIDFINLYIFKSAFRREIPSES
jgi:hypothetical protein